MRPGADSFFKFPALIRFGFGRLKTYQTFNQLPIRVESRFQIHPTVNGAVGKGIKKAGLIRGAILLYKRRNLPGSSSSRMAKTPTVSGRQRRRREDKWRST